LLVFAIKLKYSQKEKRNKQSTWRIFSCTDLLNFNQM